MDGNAGFTCRKSRASFTSVIEAGPLQLAGRVRGYRQPLYTIYVGLVFMALFGGLYFLVSFYSRRFFFYDLVLAYQKGVFCGEPHPLARTMDFHYPIKRPDLEISVFRWRETARISVPENWWIF